MKKKIIILAVLLVTVVGCKSVNPCKYVYNDAPLKEKTTIKK